MKSNKTMNWLSVFLLFMASLGNVAVADSIDIENVLEAYPSVQRALVVDDLSLAQGEIKNLISLASQWEKENGGNSQVTTVQSLREASVKLQSAEDLDEARKAFILISKACIKIIRAEKKLQEKWQLFYCPMVAKQEGYWIEPNGEELANPYMGSTMPGCGTKKAW